MARRSDHTREQLHRMALAATKAIVAKEGLRGLSTRRIAVKLGYSPGTLYQLFEDLDDIIEQLNIATLEALFAACDGINLKDDPEKALDALAERYIQFVKAHAQLWNALFEHHLPRGRAHSARYVEQVEKLLGLAASALEAVVPESSAEQRAQDALVLWSSLYGIASLASADKLGPGIDPMALVRVLVKNYIAGLSSSAG